jgi:GTP-binding protein EngB required for normal cell division
MSGGLHERPASRPDDLTKHGERLQLIDSICRRFHIESLSARIFACAEALKDEGVVDVAVLGHFKSGKSSFLNAVIGKSVLPVSVLPLTSVVTRIQFGTKDRAVVKFKSNEALEIPTKSIAEYVTERQNPDNKKNVEMVDVELACLERFRGIRFVDTPGLGSVFTHNSRTSTEWLPKVGAALLAVSVDQPMSEADAALFKELEPVTPEISILLTKADLVTGDEIEQIRRFVSQKAGEIKKDNLRIFPFSIRPGYESYQDAVKEYLFSQVSGRSREMADEIIRHKMAALTKSCREYLNMALASAEADEKARAGLAEQIETERRALSSMTNEIRVLTLDWIGRLRTDSLDISMNRYREMLFGLEADLRPKMKSWRGDIRGTAKQFNRWASESLGDRLEPLSVELGEQLRVRYLASAHDDFSRVVRGFQDRLAEGIEKALGMKFTGADFEANVQQPKKPDISIGKVFDFPLEMLWFLIPMPIFRPLVNRHFLRNRLPWEVEKNLSRLAAQWSKAIEISIEDLALQARLFIKKELDTIDGLVADAKDRRPEIDRVLSELGELEKEEGGK